MQFAFVTLALACLAVASPSSETKSPTCNSGPVQCCNSVQSVQSANVVQALGPLGVATQGLTGLAGLKCSPITAVDLGSKACTQQTVCCTNNSFNGVVALGCTPININA
ncbi:hydrophobin-251 [Pholiota molesta]|nr:hydrophobin-251 [Pholiota molesta]